MGLQIKISENIGQQLLNFTDQYAYHNKLDVGLASEENRR